MCNDSHYKCPATLPFPLLPPTPCQLHAISFNCCENKWNASVQRRRGEGGCKAADFGSQAAAANCLCVLLLLLTRSYVPVDTLLSFICITERSRPPFGHLFISSFVNCHYFVMVNPLLLCPSRESQLRTQSWHNWTGEMLNAVDDAPLPSGGSSVSAH